MRNIGDDVRPFGSGWKDFWRDLGSWATHWWWGLRETPEQEQKRKAKEDGFNIIGVKTPRLTHKTNTGWGTWTQTTQFHDAGDWVTLKADAARIKLTNDTGSTGYLREIRLIGKPVVRNSGVHLHDKFKDWADIEKNGDKPIMYASDDIINQSHTNNIADYLWKDVQQKKHFYLATMQGTCFWLHPGEWYTLTIGGAGQSENIDSKVRLVSVKTQKKAGSLGLTYLVFEEVQENWKHDSTASSRAIANSLPWRNPQGASVIVISSGDGTELAHVYCDGTTDETEINEAISRANEVGGGVVHLGKGTFHLTTAAIQMKANVRLEGEGNSTVISRDGANSYAIQGAGGSGTEIDGIQIASFKIENGVSGGGQDMIEFEYCDNLLIQDIYIDNPASDDAMTIQSCDGVVVRGVYVLNSTGHAILINGDTQVSLGDIIIDGNADFSMQTGIYVSASSVNVNMSNITVRNFGSNASDGAKYGIRFGSDHANLENIQIKDLANSDAAQNIYGIYINNATGIKVNNATIDNVDNANTASKAYGIYIDNEDDTVLSGILVKNVGGTGVEIVTGSDGTVISGRITGNGTNYTDNGTNTNSAGLYQG